MSILSGYKKVKNYIETGSGKKLLSRWTSSNTVEFNDGKTAQTKVGAIKGITTSTSATETGYAADATTVAALNQSLETTNENLKNLLTPNSQNQSIKMFGGSKVVNVTHGTVCKLFTCAEINSLLGTFDATVGNTVMFVANGDPRASFSIPSSRYSTNDDSWYVIFDTNTSGSYRVNYMLFYFKN